jgi:cytoplasmic iron level regulating protein YaaA (DUF328/UPF0246 family)
MIIIITPCSASKDDSSTIPNNFKIVQSSHYLDDKNLISHLQSIREQIFRDPRTCVGAKITYAFDLYVNAGKAYRGLRESSNQQRLKSTLISDGNIQWFFLSGGYGIINALEATKKYQATFDRNIAHQRKIPYTANLWESALTQMCSAILSKFQPTWLYVFGSKSYTYFIKQTDFWKTKKTITMFESTGQQGPSWLSPKLNEMASSIFNSELDKFNKRYPKFVKQ